MKSLLLTGALFLLLHPPVKAQSEAEAVNDFIQHAFYLSEVMLHDAASPPAAARFYAYAMWGAFQSLPATHASTPLTSCFHAALSLDAPPLPTRFSEYFCAIYAMLEIGKQMMPSGYLLKEKEDKLLRAYRKKYKWKPQDAEENRNFALQIAAQVIAYARTDGYFLLSALPRYKPVAKEEGHWYPTPPEYMAASEPHWKTIRPFFLDSAGQFAPPLPVPFSTDKESAFFSLLEEVYRTGNALTKEQKEAAAFWDCNPFAVFYSGHAAIGLKKISPGGHWILISGIACRQAKASFRKTAAVHAMLALVLHDAFISCWDEKYRSDRIRPQTAINRHVNAEWTPLLQTPPFPEYTSGHSVVSAAAAEVLSYFFGDKFRFTDTSEEYFGLPPRTFNSFREAADEAALSRLYGGIHFRDAIEDGQKQGTSIGNFVISKVKRVNLADY